MQRSEDEESLFFACDELEKAFKGHLMQAHADICQDLIADDAWPPCPLDGDEDCPTCKLYLERYEKLQDELYALED